MWLVVGWVVYRHIIINHATCGLTCKKVFERIHFRLKSKLTQTPPRPPTESFQLPSKHPSSRLLPDTFQTSYRQSPDTLQTLSRPSKHLQGTFSYLFPPLKVAVPKFQVTRRVVVVVVVVVVGLQVHNHATTWPNLQDGTCKNSIQIEFQVGPECGNKGKQKAWPRHISGVSQAYLRCISGISQVYLRHISHKSQRYIRHISDVSPAYFSQISGIYQAYISHISGISVVYLKHNSIIF